MPKMLFLDCLIGLSPAISSQFTLKMCASAKKLPKKSLKTPFWGFKVVQGHRCE